MSPELLDALQWPAMVATIAGAWFVASRSRGRRRIGFVVYLVSNALWVAWGVAGSALAVVVLQFFLLAMNIRGLRKTED